MKALLNAEIFLCKVVLEILTRFCILEANFGGFSVNGNYRCHADIANFSLHFLCCPYYEGAFSPPLATRQIMDSNPSKSRSFHMFLDALIHMKFFIAKKRGFFENYDQLFAFCREISIGTIIFFHFLQNLRDFWILPKKRQSLFF